MPLSYYSPKDRALSDNLVRAVHRAAERNVAAVSCRSRSSSSAELAECANEVESSSDALRRKEHDVSICMRHQLCLLLDIVYPRSQYTSVVVFLLTDVRPREILVTSLTLGIKLKKPALDTRNAISFCAYSRDEACYGGNIIIYDRISALANQLQ